MHDVPITPDLPSGSEGSVRTTRKLARLECFKAVNKGQLIEGSAVFEASIDSAPPEERARIRQLLEWARTLESDGLVTLESFRGVNRWILLPRLVAEGAGLVSVWNDGRGTLQLWRSVFEKKARQFITPVEASIGGPIKQGGTAKQWDESTLRLLSDAYRHAARTSDEVQ